MTMPAPGAAPPPPTTDEAIFVALPRRGYAEAIERVAFTAAPLLAGFAVTFIGHVLAANVPMRWPNATLVALITAVLLLILTVQLAFNARAIYLPYSELKQQLELIPGKDSAVRAQYVADLAQHRRMVRWTAVAYNLGIAALLFAVAAALVPTDDLDDIDAERAIAIAIATVAAAGELGWTIVGELRARRTPAR